jgi:hypothetical protein
MKKISLLLSVIFLMGVLSFSALAATNNGWMDPAAITVVPNGEGSLVVKTNSDVPVGDILVELSYVAADITPSFTPTLVGADGQNWAFVLQTPGDGTYRLEGATLSGALNKFAEGEQSLLTINFDAGANELDSVVTLTTVEINGEVVANLASTTVTIQEAPCNARAATACVAGVACPGGAAIVPLGCANGEVCNNANVCVAECVASAATACAAEVTCVNGVAGVGAAATGCQDGQACVNGVCPDPVCNARVATACAAGVACPGGGAIPATGCQGDQVCTNGACADPVADLTVEASDVEQKQLFDTIKSSLDDGNKSALQKLADIASAVRAYFS